MPFTARQVVISFCRILTLKVTCVKSASYDDPFTLKQVLTRFSSRKDDTHLESVQASQGGELYFS